MNQERPDLYELSALISRQAEIVEKLADSAASPGHPTLEDRIDRLERRQKLLLDGLIVSLTASRRLFSTSALYTVASKRFLLEQGNLTDEELAYHAPFFEMADSVGEMVGAMDTVISATQRLREVDEDIEEPPAATENS